MSAKFGKMRILNFNSLLDLICTFFLLVVIYVGHSNIDNLELGGLKLIVAYVFVGTTRYDVTLQLAILNT